MWSSRLLLASAVLTDLLFNIRRIICNDNTKMLMREKCLKCHLLKSQILINIRTDFFIILQFYLILTCATQKEVRERKNTKGFQQTANY